MCGSGREGENQEAASDPHIPTELCEEILYRLPSIDLLKFKLVSKDWLRLISSARFIHKHLQRSKADYNHSKILLISDSGTAILDYADNKNTPIPFTMQFLGSCDGFVLFYEICDRIIGALNPDTGEPAVIGIQVDPSELIFSWFGHHPSTGEYVLALATRSKEERDTIILKVYSLSLSHETPLSSSTLKLDTQFVDDDNCNRIGTLLHGRLHYPVNYKHFVLVYDFETNKIMRMSAPPPLGFRIQVLGVVDGCLCAIQDKKVVWIMKEYGVEESWTIYTFIVGFEDGSILRPLTFCPNGDVITTENSTTSSIVENHSARVTWYGFKERGINVLKVAYKNWVIDDSIACIDSLVSPASLFMKLDG